MAGGGEAKVVSMDQLVGLNIYNRSFGAYTPQTEEGGWVVAPFSPDYSTNPRAYIVSHFPFRDHRRTQCYLFLDCKVCRRTSLYADGKASHITESLSF